jgi:glycosyltransferase involved in cell wall biosynthesis
MATGLPIVATAVGGNGEVVLDGATGRLVRASDPAALASALASIARDPALAERLGAAGRARALAEFSIASMASRHAALLERFARLRSPARRAA